MRSFRLFFFLCAFSILGAACSPATPTEQVSLPPLPTAKVPSVTEIEAAIKRWQDNQPPSYYAILEESRQDRQWRVRLVVADGQIRAAQSLEKDGLGNWGEPKSLPLEEARAYAVDQIFTRLLQDATGNGQTPVNLEVIFDASLGFPQVIHAEALPVYNEAGGITYDRQYSYDMTIQLKELMEDSFGKGKETIYSYLRSGGPQAWCDNLRIFQGGSSAYTDDCREKVLQMTVPDSRLQQLEELRASFSSLDDLRLDGNQIERLIINGTGEGTPDPAELDAAWNLADELNPLLTEPIGLGLIMSYLEHGQLLGYNVFNKRALPADLRPNGSIFGATSSLDGKYLAYSDDTGLSILETDTKETSLLLKKPAEGHYLPRAWSSSRRLLVSLIPESDVDPIQHGWVSIEEKTWHVLPLPEGSTGYGCNTGMAWSPDASQVAVTGLDYGSACNMNPGLTIANLTQDSAQRVVETPIQTGEEQGLTIQAGAHTPAWAPDSEWIAFALDQDASAPLAFPARLYRVHPDGSNLTPLTNNSQGIASDPLWTQDGTLLYGLTGVSVETDGIYRYTPADNTHTLLIAGSELRPLSISPDREFLAYEENGTLKLWEFRLQETIAEVPVQEDSPPTFVGWVVVGGE